MTAETSNGSSELRLRLYCYIEGIYRLFKVTVLGREGNRARRYLHHFDFFLSFAAKQSVDGYLKK